MGLEAADYISELVPTNPTGVDQKLQGDDHLRLVKHVLQTTFPNLDGEVSGEPGEFNAFTNLYPFAAGDYIRASGLTTLEKRTAAQTRSDIGADNASNLASGTLPDARLSSNVPLKDTAATITAAWTFTGAGVVGLLTDGKELRFGTGGDDFALYHDGADNYIDSNTGALYLRGSPGNSYLAVLSQAAGIVHLSGTSPSFRTIETDQAADEKIWSFGGNSSSTFIIGTRTDADGAGDSAITITRTGTAIGIVRLLGETRIDALNSNSVVVSGTYTPTLTGVANVQSSTSDVCQYMRVGNTVTVSGRITIDPTSASQTTTLGISLPIASAFSNARQCAGTGCMYTGTTATPGRITGDTTNDRAEYSYFSAGTVAEVLHFQFTYLIV